jgi:hypothetical protein
VALAVLHNIAISRNDPDFEPEGNDGFGDEDDDNEPEDVDTTHTCIPLNANISHVCCIFLFLRELSK